MSDPISSGTRDRAQRTGGTSASPIYEMVNEALAARSIHGEIAVDLGCGAGALHATLRERFRRYIGVDAVRYPGFPAGAEFMEADLNERSYPVPGKIADAVFALETIEHLENPRALMREMARIAKPGGWMVVTTPNQLSALSLGTLLFKRHFSAFQEVHYPAHITALLESDLVHIAKELTWARPQIQYSHSGRIVLTPLHYPRFVANLFPRLCSDNILLIAQAP